VKNWSIKKWLIFIEVEIVYRAKSTYSNISEKRLKKTVSEGCRVSHFKSF